MSHPLIDILTSNKAKLKKFGNVEYTKRDFCKLLLSGLKLKDPADEVFAVSSILDLFEEV